MVKKKTKKTKKTQKLDPAVVKLAKRADAISVFIGALTGIYILYYLIVSLLMTCSLIGGDFAQKGLSRDIAVGATGIIYVIPFPVLFVAPILPVLTILSAKYIKGVEYFKNPEKTLRRYWQLIWITIALVIQAVTFVAVMKMGSNQPAAFAIILLVVTLLCCAMFFICRFFKHKWKASTGIKIASAILKVLSVIYIIAYMIAILFYVLPNLFFKIIL